MSLIKMFWHICKPQDPSVGTEGFCCLKVSKKRNINKNEQKL